MDLKAGREFLKFAAVGATAAVRRAWNREDGERFLLGALSSMPGAPAKIGQMLGMRSFKDIPAPTAMSVADVKALVSERHPKLSQVIMEMSPWARTASLGQTHEALLASGEHVAMKVQYPAVRSQLAAQIDVIFGLAGMSPARNYDFDVGATRAFVREKMLEETNYLQEMAAQKKVYRDFAGSSVVVAKVFEEWCTDLILVQSWEPSQPVSDVGSQWIYRHQMAAAQIFTGFVLKSMFGSGLIHTDLSPGNYGFRLDNDDVRLVVYDFGSTHQLSSTQQISLWQWLEATRSKDADAVLAALVHMGFSRGRLRPIVAKLLSLSELLLAPWLDGHTWNAAQWHLQEQFDALLGIDKWWFRTAGPPWFMYLMRTLQGWHHGMLAIDAQIDFTQVWHPWAMRMTDLAENAPKMYGDESNAADNANEFVPIARTLKVHVTEHEMDVVELELPSRAIVDLETLLPENVSAKCASDGIDLLAIRDRAIATGGAPQELFSASHGMRRYRVWLEA